MKKGRVAWNKGHKKIQDLNEIRECKTCKKEKVVTEFRKAKAGLYRYICKSCYAIQYRTGKPNTGRFQKGIIPKTAFKKGGISPNKGKFWSSSRQSEKCKIWKSLVQERDGFKCQKCSSFEKLVVHHIKSWKEYPELRFEISNGLTLCPICHGKEEGPLNKNNGINTRFKKGYTHSKETRKKLSLAHTGRIKDPM